MIIQLSTLNHSWFIDLDGTIIKHNGHLIKNEKILKGVENFWAKIPKKDKIILTTARRKEDFKQVLVLLNSLDLRFDHIIFDLPLGERILINDIKPSGLKTAIAINAERDKGLDFIKLNIK
tara:strand:- start:859 stop:1221 length:363 start_codon:yes stop_codon:yes gene_type:complete